MNKPMRKLAKRVAKDLRKQIDKECKEKGKPFGSLSDSDKYKVVELLGYRPRNTFLIAGIGVCS
jgi:hypothetical protein